MFNRNNSYNCCYCQTRHENGYICPTAQWHEANTQQPATKIQQTARAYVDYDEDVYDRHTGMYLGKRSELNQQQVQQKKDFFNRVASMFGS